MRTHVIVATVLLIFAAIITSSDNSFGQTEIANVRVHMGPSAVAINPNTNTLYVLSNNMNTDGWVTVMDGVTNETKAVIEVDAGADSIAVNPVTNKIYVSSNQVPSITVIDGATNTTTTIAAGSPSSHWIVVNTATNKIYVSNNGTANVTVIDGATNTATSVSTATCPSTVALNQVTNKVYVAHECNNLVSVIDGTDNSIQTVSVNSPGNLAVNPVTNKIYVTALFGNNATVIDGATNATHSLGFVGINPTNLVINPITNKIYIANPGSDNVAFIDGTTETMISIATGRAPVGLAVNPETNSIYVSNFHSGDLTGFGYLTLIDGETNATRSVPLRGGGSSGVSVNPITNRIYVANSGPNNLNGNISIIDGASGLISYWPGDDNANDIQSGHNGTLFGTTNFDSSNKKFGSASFKFNSPDDFIQVADNSELQLANAFTLSAWVNVANLSSKSSTDDSYIVDKQNHYSLLLKSDGRVQLTLNSPENPMDLVTTDSISLNQWHQITATYDRYAGAAKIYIDGVLSAQSAYSQPIIKDTYPLRIGCFTNGGGNCSSAWNFPGLIDEVRIYNHALSPNEIGSAASCTPPGSAPVGTVSWWKAEGNANDSAGSNHGTLQNGVSFAPAIVGQGFNFNGDAAISVASPTNLPTGNTPYTIELWMKPTSLSFTGMIGYGNFGYYSEVNALRIATESCPGGRGIQNYWWQNDIIACSDDIDIGKWAFVVAEYDGTMRRIFINGVEVESDTPSAPRNSPGVNLTIGRTFSGEPIFEGIIDELTIYNRALSAAEIHQTYTAGALGKFAAHSNPVCAGSTLQLNATNVSGGSFVWTGPLQFHSTAQNPFIDDASTDMSGDYTVTVVDSCASNSAMTSAIVVDPTAVTAWNNSPIDAGTPLEIQATPIQGATYSWSGPNGFYSNLQNPSIPNTTDSNTGTYSFTVTSACGTFHATTDVVVRAVSSSIHSGIVSWWPANGDAIDLISGNNGILMNGTSFGTGIVGQGFRFDGVDDTITVNSPTNLPIGNSPYTIEVWIKPTSLQQRGIIGYGNFGNYSQVNALRIATESCPGGRGIQNYWWQNDIIACSDDIDIGKWAFVVAEYDGTTRRVFINGLEVNSDTPSAPRNSPGVNFMIGRTYSGEPVFAGVIDELTIYNRALTPQEILAVYSAGSLGKGYSTTTSLSSSLNPSDPGQSVTFTATVNSQNGTQTGSVRFLDGNTSLGIATLTNQNATITVSLSRSGPHDIRASYIGDSNFRGSVSNALTQTINGTPSGVPSGIVSWWPANGDATDVISGNNGTLHNETSFAQGYVGQGFQFDGVDDTITVNSATNLPVGNSPYTIEVWIKPTSLQYTGIIGYGNFGNYSEVNALRIATESCPGGRGIQNYWWANDIIACSDDIDIGKWALVIAEYDGTTRHIYINGVEVQSDTPSAPRNSPGTNLMIGRTYNGEPVFAGIIDELTIYNRALSATEILAIYNAGSLGKGYSTTTTLSSSLNPSKRGEAVIFTATVNSQNATPTGNVRFADGNISLGTSSLSNGQTSITVSSLTSGTHMITASYDGDSNFHSSVSTALTQNVNYVPLNESTILGIMSDGTLASINPQIASVSPISTITSPPSSPITSVTNSKTKELYLIYSSVTGQMLKTVNLQTGESTEVPVFSGYGLEVNPSSRQLFFDSFYGESFSILDPDTGVSSVSIQKDPWSFTTGNAWVSGNQSAFDPSTNRFFLIGIDYARSPLSSYLETVNVDTNAWRVAQLPVTDIRAMEFDPQTRKLYLISQNELGTFDPDTNEYTSLMAIPFSVMHDQNEQKSFGSGFHAATRTFYALSEDSEGRHIVTINVDTLQASQSPPINPNIERLEFVTIANDAQVDENQTGEAFTTSVENAAGARATLINNTSGSGTATVSVESLGTFPGKFKIGSGNTYVDVEASGVDPSDTLTVKFYYPVSLNSEEPNVALKYFNTNSHVYETVLSSGGVAVTVDTSDNQDGTVSGGSITVIFDSTSTPKITELNGIVTAPAQNTNAPSESRLVALTPEGNMAFINTDTGAGTLVGSFTVSVNNIWPMTLNANSHTFHLIQQGYPPSGNYSMLSVNTLTGARSIVSVNSSNRIWNLEADPLTNQLFAITRCCPAQFGTLHPTSAAFTSISSIPLTGSQDVYGVSTIDPGHHKMFFFYGSGSDNYMATVDTQTGVVTTLAPFPITNVSNPDSLSGFEFDEIANKLYLLSSDHLWIYDLATQQFSTPIPTPYANYWTAFHASTRSLLIDVVDQGGQQHIATMNVDTLQTTLSPPLNPSIAYTYIFKFETIVNTSQASVNQTTSTSNAPDQAGEAGVSATLTNNTAGSGAASVTVENLGSTSGEFQLGADTSYVDVRASGVDSGDVLNTKFYYPTTLDSEEPNVILRYLNPVSLAYEPVLSSGGAAVVPNTTNNQNNTVSGGSFSVTFDNTSTPKITQLTGTVFAFIAPDATSTSLSSTPNPALVGQSINFVATVTAQGEIPASGYVTFTDNGNVLATSSLVNGVAQFATSTLPTGTHTIKATFPSANNFVGSASANLSQVVQPSTVNTTTILNSSLNPSTVGQSLTFTAQVTPASGSGIPAGIVRFNIDGTPSDVSLASGSASLTRTLTVGTHTITASYLGNANFNSSVSSSLSQRVLYNYSGFFQPVDNTPTYNRVKAGSAIPVKFSLAGNQGLSILAAGSPSTVPMNCTNATVDDVEQTVTASNSSLAYDATANQYIYTWKTDKAWANTCRQLTVTLNDGTSHTAYFTFTK